MDSTPLYSAEQIVVPSELAQILKDFTKDVIRAQPRDIYEYSRQYFANLARTKGRISKHQLVKFRFEKEREKNVKEKKTSVANTKEAIRAACERVKISKEVQDSILNQMKDLTASMWDEFLVLGATLLGEDAVSCLHILFEVYAASVPAPPSPAAGSTHITPASTPSSTVVAVSGGRASITKEDCLIILKMLAKHDPMLSDSFLHSVDSSISSKMISFDDLIRIPIVRGTLKPAYH
eukprot:TRINITY_DN20146_c0_g1_i1.p1 TRINITY_DN20146_c0_g1~~TRINITY_DN20146_c0_g1_i1.p1  ORF type:complete len:236 (+),score=42.52 TRINITY_DN20146_c0_g1_i1:49-756(+)